MYLYKEEAEKLLKQHKISMAKELKDKTEFMLSLLKADDWSMIIKSHALIEAVVTELIIAKTEETKLKPLIERLPLSDEQIGKLKIAKDYNLLTDRERTFVKRFSELRNMLVHKFENVNFNIEKYFESFDKNQKKSWLKTMTWYTDDTKTKEEWQKISTNHPQIGIWYATMTFVSLMTIKIKEIEGSTQVRNASYETTKALLKEDA